MRCHNCGADNSDDEAFCAVCGHRIIERRFRDWVHWGNLSLEGRRITKMAIAAWIVLMVAVLITLTMFFRI
jgi:uncharacterized membrane protein YvbJ